MAASDIAICDCPARANRVYLTIHDMGGSIGGSIMAPTITGASMGLFGGNVDGGMYDGGGNPAERGERAWSARARSARALPSRPHRPDAPPPGDTVSAPGPTLLHCNPLTIRVHSARDCTVGMT